MMKVPASDYFVLIAYGSLNPSERRDSVKSFSMTRKRLRNDAGFVLYLDFVSE